MNAVLALTEFGNLAVLLPVTMLLAVWLSWKQSAVMAFWWLAAVVFCTGLTAVLKVYFYVCPPAPDLHSPSGHTGFSTLVYGALALVLAARNRGWQRGLVLAAGAIVIVAIGLSRIALGAHTVAEVLFGFAVGGVSLAFFAACYRRRRARNVALGGLVLATVAVLAVFHGQQVFAEAFLHTIGLDLHRDGMACVL